MSIIYVCIIYSIYAVSKGVQFLNVTPLSRSSACLSSASARAPVIVIVPFTSIYESA